MDEFSTTADPNEAQAVSFIESIQKAFSRDFRVSGFTFIRNGVKFSFPFRESILSALPIVDELIVNVGKGEDDTLKEVQALAAEHSKIKIIESVWDDSLREGGQILAQQTDIAIAACSGDWGIYLQADEVLHEDDYMWILDALKTANRNSEIEGVLFDYLHFYGDFRVINWHPSAYRHEIRGIRLNRGVRSYGDAQGFRLNEKKLKVIKSNARIYHYGWVRPPEVMQAKTVEMDSFYHPDGEGTGDNYKYKRVLGLEKFSGTHPMVMMDRIAAQKDWSDKLLRSKLHFKFKDFRNLFYRWCEKLTGSRPFEYKNYILVPLKTPSPAPDSKTKREELRY